MTVSNYFTYYTGGVRSITGVRKTRIRRNPTCDIAELVNPHFHGDPSMPRDYR